MHRLLPVLILACISCAPDRQDWPRECPNPGRDDVHYYPNSWAERGRCDTDDWACPQEGMEPLFERFPNFIENDCGCGCFGLLDEDVNVTLD